MKRSWPAPLPPLVAATLAAAGFIGVEAAVAALAPRPLDPPLGLSELGLGLLGLGLLYGIPSLARPPRAVLLGALAWAAVWGPEAARGGGLSPSWGWAAVLLLGLVGLPRPRLALGLSVVGALATPALRAARPDSLPVGASEGLHRNVTTVTPEYSVNRPDILLITVDTVRADGGLRPGCSEGATQGQGGAIEGWTHYSSAVAAAPWTLPSFHSLFTGEPVVEHGGGLPTAAGFTTRAPGHPSFVSALAAAGYRTEAWVSNPHLRVENGFAEGFARWNHSDRARDPVTFTHAAFGLWSRLSGRVHDRVRLERDERLVEGALASLRGPGDAPRFTWVHLLGPHEYRRMPLGRDAGEDPAGWRAAWQDNVQATCRLTDHLIAAAPPGVVIALTSDHGEAFGEGGHFGHGSALDDAQLLVELSLRPGTAPGRRIEAPVPLTALADSLLSAAGLSAGEELADAPALIAIPVGGLRAGRAFALRRADGRYVLDVRSPPQSDPEAVDGDTVDALRALGYLER